ncbi:unnamed protein product, partial [Symbiodinium microadriaticum]
MATSVLSIGASAADVESALEALPNVNDVSVFRDSNSTFDQDYDGYRYSIQFITDATWDYLHNATITSHNSNAAIAFGSNVDLSVVYVPLLTGTTGDISSTVLLVRDACACEDTLRIQLFDLGRSTASNESMLSGYDGVVVHELGADTPIYVLPVQDHSRLSINRFDDEIEEDSTAHLELALSVDAEVTHDSEVNVSCGEV